MSWQHLPRCWSFPPTRRTYCRPRVSLLRVVDSQLPRALLHTMTHSSRVSQVRSTFRRSQRRLVHKARQSCLGNWLFDDCRSSSRALRPGFSSVHVGAWILTLASTLTVALLLRCPFPLETNAGNPPHPRCSAPRVCLVQLRLGLLAPFPTAPAGFSLPLGFSLLFFG